MTSPIPAVSIHGISLGGIVTGAGVWTGVITFLTWLIRTRVPMAKMKLEADQALRDDLMEQLRRVGEASDRKVAELQTKLESNDADCDAKLSVFRHRLNNVTQCLDAILMLIEAAPDQAAAHVKRIQEMRARQASEEALEKGAILGGKISAATLDT